MLPFFRRQPYGHANRSNNRNQIVAVPPSNPENIANLSVAESTADLVVTQIMDQTAMQTQRFRAKATNNQYDPRVVEFKVWCNQMYSGTPLETRYTVTEGKLVAFLQMCVIGRKSKNGEEEVGISTVKAYRSAIVDLYRTQVSMKVNSHPHPAEGKVIKDLMNSIKRDKADHMKRNYVDRGRKNFRMKSLTKNELHKITDYHWKQKTNIHNALRDDMSEFNMRAMAVRGEHMRNIELPDLFLDDIPDQGMGECKAVISVLNKGKTNHFGKEEFAATLRHRDVLTCPQSKMAFYFANRFDLSEEELPNFENNESWFDIKLFRNKVFHEKKKAVSYQAHLRSVQNCYRACGFRVLKKTHLMRGDSVRYAQAKGLNREERRAMGRWENGSMDECYARSLPVDAMRTMAGFHPTIRDYRINRDIEVPKSLLVQVFPGIENLLEEEKQKTDKIQSYAKIQFLELLIYFRKVFLQDSCRLKIRYPDHPIWKHPVFSDDEYGQFQSDVLDASDEEHLESATLEEKLPAVFEIYNQKINELMRSHEKLRKYMRQGLLSIRNAITSAKICKNYSDADARKIEKAAKRMINHVEGFGPASDDEDSESDEENNYPASNAVLCKRTATRLKMYSGQKRDSIVLDEDERPKSRMRFPDGYRKNPPSTYKMDRDITTVSALWKEWYIGTKNIPAVDFLEKEYGPNWRREERDRIWFVKRKTVIRIVHDLVDQNGWTKEEAVEHLDKYLVEDSKSLNYLAENRKKVLEALK